LDEQYTAAAEKAAVDAQYNAAKAAADAKYVAVLKATKGITKSHKMGSEKGVMARIVASIEAINEKLERLEKLESLPDSVARIIHYLEETAKDGIREREAMRARLAALVPSQPAPAPQPAPQIPQSAPQQ